MTVTPPEESSYSVRETEDRGRAVFASRTIPAGTTVLVTSRPFVSVIKRKFEKEVCAWCYTYQHGRSCSIKLEGGNTGLWFCTTACLEEWATADCDGKLAESLASLRTTKAIKVCNRFELMLTFLASFKESRVSA
jgi:hypothetical protein